MKHRGLYLLFLLIVTILPYGCEEWVGVKRVKSLEEVAPHPGLDTIPNYPRRSYAFNTKAALERLKKKEEKKTKEEAVLIEELRKRFGERLATLNIPDPWLPPPSPPEMPLALKFLPKDAYGYVNWADAVRKKLINPKESLRGKNGDEEESIPEFDRDIIYNINDRYMADVKFSHKIHNFWFSCNNCHPAIFIDKKGANPATMYDIWAGKYCGRCHGKVAFMAKGFENCRRCHSVRKGQRR